MKGGVSVHGDEAHVPVVSRNDLQDLRKAESVSSLLKTDYQMGFIFLRSKTVAVI